MMQYRALGRKAAVAVAAGAAVFGITSAVQASIPDSNGIAHACYNASLAHGSPIGAMRAIDTDKPTAGGMCAPWEGSVDLATPQYVQQVVASTVNQTSITAAYTLSYPINGDWETTWTCPAGYVGIDPWVQSNEYFGHNHYLTVKSEANLQALAGGPFGTQVRIYYNISTGTPWDYVNGITCVDGRVYGQPGPASPAAATVKATVRVQHD